MFYCETAARVCVWMESSEKVNMLHGWSVYPAGELLTSKTQHN